jgi:hypothetical protein
LSSDADATVVEVTGDNSIKWVLMVSNGKASTTAQHQVTANGQTYKWTGNYKVLGVKQDAR